MQPDLRQQDQRQRELALNPSASFIVQAPAGSGKTELLIQRFLTLLSTVNKPEEILSITFTKKAAHEMRMRVIKAIKSAQHDPEPASPHAKKTWLIAKKVLARDEALGWQIANNPNQLRIQTIDSLCANLTKHLPLLAHFGSQPAIADNADSMYEDAVRNVLFHIEEDQPWTPAIANLLLHVDNDLNKLLELLVDMLKQRDQWLPHVHIDHHSTIKAELEAQLSDMIEETLEEIEALLPFELHDEMLALARMAASNLALSGQTSPINACLDIESIHPAADELEKWRGLMTLLLTDDGTWRVKITKNLGFPAPSESKNAQEKALLKESKDRMSALLAKLAEYDDFREALSGLKYIPSAAYTEKQWEMLTSLFQVLKVCTAQLRVIFQQRGMIDYIENAQAAILALGNDEHPTDLALALDYQIKHILLDEFQDTSLTQYTLLEKLIAGWEPNDGRTLFVVGDPMQSIYRFRQADVGIFIRMWENGIGHVQLTPLTLSVNFRSTPAVIQWNNAYFEKIFPAHNSMATGSVTYTHSTPHQIEETTQADSYIKLQGYVNSPDHVMANAIAETISQLKVNYPNDSIAVLVRSRSCLDAIIPALKRSGIAYQAVDIDRLSSRQIIQDLFALTRALLHPADRIAWLAVLRAPWCGLTLADLHVLAGRHAYDDIYTQLLSANVVSQLSADGQTRIQRILPAFKWAITQRQRVSLRSWIETVWLQLGGPACLETAEEMNEIQTYLNLLGQFDIKNHDVNLDVLKKNIDNLFAGTSGNEAGVHLMTIHNAKGLEFDTVILPHLEAKNPNEDRKLLLWMDRPLANDKSALLLAPISATGDEQDRHYDYIKRQLKLKLDLEIDRLLYVATTRAKKRLYLAFNITQNEEDKIRIESGSFLNKCWPLFSADASLELIHPDNHSNGTKETTPARAIKRLPTSWKHPLNLLPPDPYAAHITSAGFSLPDDNKRIVGIVAHTLFQQLAQRGFGWWQSQSTEKQDGYINRLLLANGIMNADLDACSQHLSCILKNILHDERAAWILKQHAEAKSEYPLTVITSKKVQSLVIDRTFIDEEGSRWIIDYKTALPLANESLDSFLVKEEQLHIDQLKSYKQAFALLDERPIRLGLYFPALPAWREIGS